MSGDNGDARASGQPLDPAFPKGFAGVLPSLHVPEDSHRANQVFNNEIMRPLHAVIASHPQLSCPARTRGTMTSDSEGA
jgi:hypothetical protein